uniref:Uncharacterized protein n=1 Tax=Anguilla anguilla TaxID=7936 RepID=A0A0E9QB28_ANGAN
MCCQRGGIKNCAVGPEHA